MTVLLDTQVLLTVGLEGMGSLPRGVRQLLAAPETQTVLSVVSFTEIAIKDSIGKIVASPYLVSRLVSDLRLRVIPYTAAHAMRMFGLPLHHLEPFDRMIIATALSENLPLVGAGEKFPAYQAEGLSLIWK